MSKSTVTTPKDYNTHDVPNKMSDDNTFFTTAMNWFPVLESDRINTEEFLEASRGVVLLTEKFGTVFTPVKYDLNQNITKIHTIFLKDKARFKYLDDLIMEESKTDSNIATDALQWLRRGLHFMWEYFHLILRNEDQTGSEAMKTAYEKTLLPYHAWMGQQCFKIIIKFAPTRTELYDVLALNAADKHEVVKTHMQEFLINLKICIDHLLQLYLTNGFERTERV